MHVLKYQNSLDIRGKPYNLSLFTHLQVLANALQLGDFVFNDVGFFS
jgi:hypothetical protein